GMAFFDYLKLQPDDATDFNLLMTSNSSAALAGILAAYDFSRFKTIVDIGGGQGALLRGILSRNPNARGILADQPAVVGSVTQCEAPGKASRYEIVGTDFFVSVPEGGDVYILKNVLHDWNDEDALRILKNCRRVMGAEARLLVIDLVL